LFNSIFMPSKSFKLVCFSHLFREANQIAKHLAGIARD
jgi:ubiquinone/menaquinone biosynthesis C-methylase UbiE